MEGYVESQRVDSRGEPILYEATCQTEEYTRYLRRIFTWPLIGLFLVLCIFIIPLLLLPIILHLCKPRIQSKSQEAVKYWRLYMTDKNIYYSFYSQSTGITIVIPLDDIKTITVDDQCGECVRCLSGIPDGMSVILILMKSGKYARYVDRYGIRSYVQILGAANAESFIEAVLGQMARLGNPHYTHPPYLNL